MLSVSRYERIIVVAIKNKSNVIYTFDFSSFHSTISFRMYKFELLLKVPPHDSCFSRSVQLKRIDKQIVFHSIGLMRLAVKIIISYHTCSNECKHLRY